MSNILPTSTIENGVHGKPFSIDLLCLISYTKINVLLSITKHIEGCNKLLLTSTRGGDVITGLLVMTYHHHCEEVVIRYTNHSSG